MHEERDNTIWPLGLMCLIATITLGISAQAIVAPVLISLALICYLWFGVPRMPKPRMFLALLLMVPFALWLRDMGSGMQMHYSVPIGFLFVVGLFMMALATHHLMAVHSGGSVDYALSCAVMGMGMAGTARLSESPRVADGNPIYVPLLLAFLPLLLLYLRRMQIRTRQGGGWSNRSWVPYGLAFGVLVASTFMLDRYVVHRIPELNEYVIRQLAENANARRLRASLGISSTSSVELGSWVPTDTGRDNDVALVAFSVDRPVEYLRGAAYIRYASSTWYAEAETRPMARDDEEFQGRYVYTLRESRGDQLDTTIYAESAYSDRFFLPMRAHRLATFARRVHRTNADTVRPYGDAASGGYGYFELTSTLPGLENPSPQLDAHLQVPDELRPKLRAIGDRLMGRGGTPREKIDLLRTHFLENYQYKLGIRMQTYKDPVIEFLEDHTAGHCEFFAASTALLLRAQGIPCRYVTGFVMRERGMGGMWIARRRNAHAWVEAFLPQEGWAIVEATPASAQPAVAQVDREQQFREWWDAQWMRMQRVGKFGGVKALLLMFLDWIVSLPQKLPVWLWLIAISIGMGWIFRNNLRRLFAKRQERELSDDAIAIRAMLLEAEKTLKRHGIVRPPGQTVAVLIRRVRESAGLPDEDRSEVLRLLGAYQDRRFAPLGVQETHAASDASLSPT